MTAPSPRARTVLVGAVCLPLLGVILHAAGRRAPEARPSSGPSAAELDSLARYLTPVEPAPAIDDYQAFVPAAPEPVAARPTAPAPAPPPRRLSAVLIAADRPIAIIDDRQVRPGEPLPGGARVLSIAPGHAVVREADGSLRTLRLAAGTEGSEP